MANRTASCLVVLKREGYKFDPSGWVQELRKLIAVGYVEKTEKFNWYKVTAEGEKFLKTIKEPTKSKEPVQ